MYSLSKVATIRNWTSTDTVQKIDVLARQIRVELLKLAGVVTDNQRHNFRFGLSFCLLETKVLKQ